MSACMVERVRCYFATPASSGGQPYERVYSYFDDPAGGLVTSHPPAVGDLIDLRGGTYRVRGRYWRHTRPGSETRLSVTVERVEQWGGGPS